MCLCLIYRLLTAFKADRRSVSSYLSWGATQDRKLASWRIGGGWTWQSLEPEECLFWLETRNAHWLTKTWQVWYIGSKKTGTSQVPKNSEETQTSDSVTVQVIKSSTKRSQLKSKRLKSKQRRNKRRKTTSKKIKAVNKSQTNKNSMAPSNN